MVGKMWEKLMNTGSLRGGIYAGIRSVLVSWWFGITNSGACCSYPCWGRAGLAKSEPSQQQHLLQPNTYTVKPGLATINSFQVGGGCTFRKQTLHLREQQSCSRAGMSHHSRSQRSTALLMCVCVLKPQKICADSSLVAPQPEKRFNLFLRRRLMVKQCWLLLPVPECLQ